MAAIAAAVNRDGTRTSASADELKLLASLSKGGRLAAGRFGGRDAKMARIRQQEAKLAAEYAAKLGVPSAATTGTAGTAGRGSDQSDTTSEVHLSGGGSKKRRKGGEGGAGAPGSGDAGKEPAKKQRIVIEPKIAQVAPVYEFKPTPATGKGSALLLAAALACSWSLCIRAGDPACMLAARENSAPLVWSAHALWLTAPPLHLPAAWPQAGGARSASARRAAWRGWTRRRQRRRASA